MSFDGSFVCESALQRFLARCPVLQSNPKLISLSQKGGALTADDVASTLAEPFLHPSYTIPIMGCFRPLCRNILDRAVALLRLVPSLTLDSDEEAREVEEDDIQVVDFYVGRERSLRLHELTCLALCRALDLAPFLLGSVLNYFRFSPPPFERLSTTISSFQLTEKDAYHLLCVIRVPLRFLLLEPKIFSELWDWSFCLEFVKNSANAGSGGGKLSRENMLDIRWCGIQILSIILRMSDRATKHFGLGPDKALNCFLRWEGFCQDTSLEKAGWYFQAADTEKRVCSDGTIDFSQFLQSFDIESLVISPKDSHEIESMSRNWRTASCSGKSGGSPFILTSALKKSFEMVVMAVNQKWPVLLHGPAGAGKTALINKLANISGNQVLFIHMDEQMDSKTLIGSYICAEQPGEFRWQPGSLTQAVLNGFWVVFEDIDKAPIEVQSILLPLLEGSSSFVTGHGEAVRVAESFRLFTTVSSSNNDLSHNAEGRISFSVLWRKVAVGTPNDKDLGDIVIAWYPSLEPFAKSFVDTFERVNSVTSFENGGLQISGFASPGVISRFSLRHLLKWCKRIAGLSSGFSGVALSASDCRSIYQEAVDIFASFSASSENRLSTMREIARIWGMSASEAENLYPPNKPIIQNLRLDLQVGRVTLQCVKEAIFHHSRPFVDLRSSLHVLERIACSVKYNEPVLLVGETGTGKTTLVQNLAMRLGQPLTVLNLSQQSDVADLLGGFKPTNARLICIPLHHEFKDLFCKTFSVKENEELLRRYDTYAMEKNWKKLLCAFQKSVEFVRKKVYKLRESGRGTKRRRSITGKVLEAWESFSVRLDAARKQISSSACMCFSFVEGAFITALRKGHWILLDEVNLAPPETLQRVIGVLDGENGSLCLAERGDVDCVARHSHFRIFACMNPATDAGKRDLPHSFRSRFTEYFVDDVLDDEDLTLFINRYMDEIHTNGDILSRIVRFYKAAKRESEERLQDGANQKPQFSLRSLARALEYTKKAQKNFGFQKALYDGFCMFFLTLLDGPSSLIMNQMILSQLLGGTLPPNVPFDRYFSEKSIFADCSRENYVLTKSVKEHLRNLARAVYIKRYPVLLQGPTSSGKTSLVQYLASVTGHEFVRINNHEHTDLQEYFGSYITNAYGKLEFQEGILVKAVRKGYWIVLDELNLAPSDVLEALNRLLDDNRELFVPELQETVAAHPDFMLFATQNPPTFYGGRKMLSRAFRNRFLEIHVEEIPEDELSTILERRCKIPPSYAMKMVEVMKDLQLHRQNSKVFAGKHGFITPRDLFRWANRFCMFGKSYEDLAKDGYLLLAERLREESEKGVVREILEMRLRVKLSIDKLYIQESTQLGGGFDWHKHPGLLGNLGNIIWTKSMQRLFFLVERCYKLREPVLLVGETGGGKTTVCQLLSVVLESKLHTLNCHQYTETSDFLGGFHPVRDRSRLAMEFKCHIEKVKLSKIFLCFSGNTEIPSDIEQASSTLDSLNAILYRYKQNRTLHPDVTEVDLTDFEQVKLDLMQLQQKWQTLFLWQDGPLVQAMKDGDVFLVDEISLADDSVLERLNSVLEPERKLSLAEKGGSVLEEIIAHQNFFILATMNPGGDYGKKELSPALRNRFTEIWVPSVGDINELRSIAAERFVKSELSCFVGPMINFWEFFNQLQTGRMLTVRDLLSWVSFINATEENLGSHHAFIHGAFLVVLDGLSLGTGISKSDAGKLRESCLSFLLEQLKAFSFSLPDSQLFKMENYGWGDATHADALYHDTAPSSHLFGISPFYIATGHSDSERQGFEFLAPTTCRNALRVLRAMQLPKPVLLEGSPGVGKTSLVVALAKYSGHSVVRVNLSEQTDMMDLLGSDLPVESENGMKFAWSDGILLQAIKDGSWVLLDELNLAPQSVLEGLNAILDHRAEVYIPELGLTFKCPPSFRAFACQNPSCQGGGRKGLPKSFLNRFTKVYVDELAADDYLFICRSLHPSIPTPLLSRLICFNNRLYEDTMLFHKYGQDGSPWEFNLRDVIRSCQIIEGAPVKSECDSFLSTLYVQRMRTAADRKEVLKVYREIFGMEPLINQSPRVLVNPQYLSVGSSSVVRNHFQPTKVSKRQLNILSRFGCSFEAALHCIRHQWLCILVGPSSSGKTSFIRLLAQLTGNALNELNLSSGTDVSELIGCFEQYNAFRSCSTVICQVERYVDEYCSLRLESSWEDLIGERKDLIAQWLGFLAAINYSFSRSSAAVVESRTNVSSISLSPLVEIIEQLKIDLEKYQLPVSYSYEDLNKSLRIVLDLQGSDTRQSSAKFEWVTGGLIKAVECGEWVVLDNANLCNPTVLDRINSLVEPGQSVTINECGLIDGNPLVLRAHPKFQMFLTVDPKYGELSRAMRNRGVEIFMMEPNLLLDGEVSHDHKDDEINDVKRFLIQSGIPMCKLIEAMADAHIYAKVAGLLLGVRITLVELTRWVQLFQQLLMNGNQPMWSLQLSYDHTYLSSLGDAKGREIIMHAKLSYLSEHEWYKIDPLLGGSLSLPGGWPAPQTLRNFLWFSQEACVKQNCMYLEFLGAQCASHELSVRYGTSLLNTEKKLMPSLVPVHLLRQRLFPTDQNNFKFAKAATFDMAMANKMLFIAANWAIEQATRSDFGLYTLWFKFYSSQLQPYCGFFKSFLTILEQERDHPIWKYIFDCWIEVASHHQINVNMESLPLLSSELMLLAGSSSDLDICQKHLDNAIQCVGLLRLSLQQWNAEMDYASHDEIFHLSIFPILKSLRYLEEEVLNAIVKSPCFSQLIHIYSNLLEHHSSFWKGVISYHFECMVIVWRSLKKEALKLQNIFPEAVDTFMEESLKHISTWTFHSSKPMLWLYGGHPSLPSSADIYDKMKQLLILCDATWPREKSWKQTFKGFSENHLLLETAVMANTELRLLAMQGVCMSSYIIMKGDQEYPDTVNQLEKIYQSLSRRFRYEKDNLQMVSLSTTCCAFFPAILCGKPGFDSWLETLPLFDRKSLWLDMELLLKLTKCILADARELYEVLSKIYDHLQYALHYSMSFSSRPPTDFVPHQKILWILDAWASVDSVHAKITNFVHEMWFKWHSSLWTYWPKLSKNSLEIDHGKTCLLVQPTRMATLDQILQSIHPIKDYDSYCLKIRVASRNLWQDSSTGEGLFCVLLSSARSLFEQIIYAHKKSFKEDKYAGIVSVFSQLKGNSLMQEKLQSLRSLILSSSHSRLTSVMDSFIEPLLNELYFGCPSRDYLHNLGLAWLHIGFLRFHLLFEPDGPDPAAKYAFKHSKLLEKISLLELEIKVRQKCERLAGRSARDDKKRLCLLQMLEEERKRLQAKVVFRPDPANLNNFKLYCAKFLEFSTMILVNNISHGNLCEWQVRSECFIDDLSKEYSAYIDIIQPVQVAVYEMKLGSSLVVSSGLEKEFLKKVEEDNSDRILAMIYSLIQFPRGLSAEGILVKPKPIESSFSSRDLTPPVNHVLEKLVTNKVLSVPLPQAAINHIILLYVAHHLHSSLLMDNDSFDLLKVIFDYFASLWVQVKGKEHDEAQLYEFRPRLIKIEDILGDDLSLLGLTDSDERLASDWEDVSLARELTQGMPAKEDDNLAEEWNLIQETILMSVVLVHNQIFGSSNLLEHPGAYQVTDEDTLCSFMHSYKLGTAIIKDLPASLSAILDEKLVQEHLLYICLEYEKTLRSPRQPTQVYNIYKDSNASVMSKMVKPLFAFRERVRSFLDEWPDHPGLQNVLYQTEKVLEIPLSTPLAKALSALEALLCKVQSLQKNDSKFSFTNQLQPIYSLVSSWRKVELDCWPVLLDGVLEQYEVNAGKLWFPLQSILYHNLSSDAHGDNMPTIQSLDEFIRTANVGEFKKRLQLLLAFHGHLKIGICLNAYSSSHLKKNLNFLYNAFGYYVQFLPLVLEQIESCRRCIEKDLNDLLKLFQWEHPHSYLSMESFSGTRQKYRKLINKFNDVLKQPVMNIFNQEATLKKDKVSAWLEQKIDMDAELVLPINLMKLSNTERLLWYGDWKNKVSSTLQSMCCGNTSGVDFVHTQELGSIINQFQLSGSQCQEFQAGWAEGWMSLEKICRSAAEFAHCWKDKTKNLRKKRALADLLKKLEACGLSKHKSMISEPSCSFLQPSYEVQHLLLQDSCTSTKKRSCLPSHSQKPADGNCASEWKMANQYYFKNLAMVQKLREICLNFHKDLTLEQVNRAASFLDHLIIIQQEQRSVAYVFSEQLKKLRRHFSSLTSIGIGELSLTPNQHALSKCMLLQKKLFDSLLAMSKDASLLLRCLGNIHLSTCDTFSAEDMISAFIDKFIPIFHECKESLDSYLLGSASVLTTTSECMPIFVSNEMEQLVKRNFEIINDFEKNVHTFCMPKTSKRSVVESLLNPFRELIGKGKMEMEFCSVLQAGNQSIHSCGEEYISMETFTKLDAEFAQMFEETNKQIINVFGKLVLFTERLNFLDDSSAEKITSWKVLFESYMLNLQLDIISDALSRTLVAAGNLINYAGHGKPEVCSQVEIQLKHLVVFLDLLLDFGNGILSEFLEVHSTVAEISHLLAQIFTSLFSKGFGDAEEQTDGTDSNRSEGAAGTGIGEGDGLNDVSNQIDDESQLLGTSEKDNDGLDNSDKVPSKNDQGIEMDEDFAADTFSVSEDSGDDDGENEEDMNLESVMGETADGNQVVDEKQWNKDEDGNPDNSVEKYESGPSMKEKDSTCEELRAKDDNSTAMDESGELDNDGFDRLSGKDDDSSISDGEENSDGMVMDKNDAFKDPTGIQFDEQKQNFEDVGMDETQVSTEETDSVPSGTDVDMGDEDGQSSPTDDHMDEENFREADGEVNNNDVGKEDTENVDMDLMDAADGSVEQRKMEPFDVPTIGTDSTERVNDPHVADSSMVSEINWSNSSDLQNGLAPSKGLPSIDVPKMELTVPDSSDGSKLSADQPKLQSSHDDTPSAQRTHPNPYRSIGDALEEWKERVEISDDSQEHQADAANDLEDDIGDEYQFVSEVEKGTSQALGPATSEQINNNIESNSGNADDYNVKCKKDVEPMKPEKEEYEKLHNRKGEAAAPRQKTDEPLPDKIVSYDASMEEIEGDISRKHTGDFVSFKSSHMNEKTLQLKDLTASDEDLTKTVHIENISDDLKHKAIADWRRYELVTTRLSQELAEQLRLVMEPTLASKLQGDYKTGKRINMKKVIPYIASHFRKDKIWLRRTRPNKRDYQVIVAVDDSRSMSESLCGNVAIEALVTVCRAMSQLEVGQLAVASFGQKGNITLLHDFDQPFTGEAGVRMISNLSFKQDNTIADEPVVDLLKHLNSMLDAAVEKARLPSGDNPLRQLILIIADGRFHEKEKLKRCVRDVISRKRMIAFLLLDSPQESIMDLMEASFQGESLSFTKYLNSFPFPYYVVLKNIEALPRTLADLLRQWFELMQSTGD